MSIFDFGRSVAAWAHQVLIPAAQVRILLWTPYSLRGGGGIHRIVAPRLLFHVLEDSWLETPRCVRGDSSFSPNNTSSNLVADALFDARGGGGIYRIAAP